MRRGLCLVGRHRWEHHRNPEVGGAGASFDTCSRCGKEKSVYGKPPPNGWRGVLGG